MEQVTINGVTYRSMREASKKLGIGYTTVKQRVEKLGWSLEEALKTPVTPVGKRVRVQGKVYKSIAEAAREIGVPLQLVYSRMNVLRWSVEKALTVPPLRS